MGLINGFYGQNNVYYWSHKDKPETKKETPKVEDNIPVRTPAPKAEKAPDIAASPDYGMEYYAGNVHHKKNKEEENAVFDQQAFLQNLEWLKEE